MAILLNLVKIIGKNVTGFNIHIEVNECLLTLDRVFETVTTFRLRN